VSQNCDLIVPKDRDAMLIRRAPVRLLGLPESLLGVLKSSPAELSPCLVILFFMRFRGTAVSVRRAVLQLSGPLVVLVMRSVVITS
jgi:hypothetical protein